MDAELSESQIVLAQKLACGEPVTRKRAIKALEKWIVQTSKEHDFNEKAMCSLCKGLYYGMWMQDKMLLQEKLADFFGSLMNLFNTEEQSFRYLKCFFSIISDEWCRVDRWRMDKFLMLVRRLTRAAFARLKLNGWSPSSCEMFVEAIKETVISPGRNITEGLKSHFASLYLDELDNAGGLSIEQVNEFLLPYAKLLAERDVTDYFFNSILDEIFITILHSYAEEAAEKVEGNDADVQNTADQGKSDSLQFDYAAIATMLFEVGKLNTVTSKRRKRIYIVVKRFNRIVDGTFATRKNVAEDKIAMMLKEREEFSNAVNSFIWDQKKNADSRKKFRRSMREKNRKTIANREDPMKPTLTKRKITGKIKKSRKVKSKKGVTLKKRKGLFKKKFAA